MSAADVELVREVYESYERGDLDRIAQIFADDVEWVQPQGYFIPDSRGTVRGRDAVMAVLARYPDYWESFTPTPEEFYDAGDGVVIVTGRQVARSYSGRDVETAFINLWRVENGQTTLHRSWSDTKTLAEALA